MDCSRPLSIQLSSYVRLLEETALLQEYAAECSIPEIGTPQPSSQVYEALERAGVLQCFAAFHVEHIVGFATVLLPIMPHYSKRVATVESIFITESARKSGIGMELMNAVEEFAKDAGCAAILWSAPTGGKLERVLRADRHYRNSNAVFVRNLA